MLVNPALALATVEGVGAVRDFRFEISRSGALGMDAFVLTVVVEPGAAPEALLAQRVKEAIGVTPRVVLAERIEGESWKARRWVDQRGA
jgi:hypothetical protein